MISKDETGIQYNLIVPFFAHGFNLFNPFRIFLCLFCSNTERK